MDHTNWQGGYPENATDAEDCVIDASEYYGDGWKASGLNYVQGGPSASGKRYVDSKFEVAFSS